ncbi:glycoside hydrolase family 12 protein [Gymnopilus junonius]|uniref:Glycoside hydrolase family 12 protein n=1 Tax=Gymnopilus junonius TaxID=109634 RepID=A0A9P5NPG1_GYMJU|nr:glycoside hydrolase family 12 protein [Gymnopilus junonius]
MFSSKLVALAALLPFVVAAPTASIDTSSHCGQWDTVTAGQYSLLLDQWGASSASSGESCASLSSLNGNTIAWKTNYTWNGGSGVKSFTNMQLNANLNKQLSAIKSIPVTWNWQQSSSSVQADIAFDIFTSSTAGGSNVNEIMIWLANIGVGPIASSYNANGAVPTTSNISLAGYTWNLFVGSNGANAVFSFLPATSGQWIQSFNADVNVFLEYLTAHQGVSTSQYLTTFQAGTEATAGSATLTTTAYTVTIN